MSFGTSVEPHPTEPCVSTPPTKARCTPARAGHFNAYANRNAARSHPHPSLAAYALADGSESSSYALLGVGESDLRDGNPLATSLVMDFICVL